MSPLLLASPSINARKWGLTGNGTVAATLWSVADDTTAELTVRFYRHFQAGMPKDEGLQAAQIELIRSPIEVMGEWVRAGKR